MVAPVKVFVPDSVSAKVAATVWLMLNAPVPLMPPEKMLSAVSRVLSVLLPRLIDPAPDRLPTDWFAESDQMAPAETLTLLPVAMALLPETANVPADTVVAPV